MSENNRKTRLAAARAARKEAGQNMFNPEVQLKRVKISNLVEAPGEISYIPISNKTKRMQEINELSRENSREVENYGLVAQGRDGVLPLDPKFRAENRANTWSTKSSSTPNSWFESGKGHILNPRTSWQNRRSVLSETRSLDGNSYRPTTPTARSINNARRASELARMIHNKQVKRYSPMVSSNPLSSVPHASIQTSQLPAETATTYVNPIYPLGRGPRRVGSSRKKKRAHKTTTRKIKSSKH